jgi:hypothetical protein
VTTLRLCSLSPSAERSSVNLQKPSAARFLSAATRSWAAAVLNSSRSVRCRAADGLGTLGGTRSPVPRGWVLALLCQTIPPEMGNAQTNTRTMQLVGGVRVSGRLGHRPMETERRGRRKNQSCRATVRLTLRARHGRRALRELGRGGMTGQKAACPESPFTMKRAPAAIGSSE